ncbi:MAG: hypothetical protein IJ829_03930, partial [Kiritimatiellae bacterium]|nr:hypothetical protein [Kiritimatiellia bacterium]
MSAHARACAILLAAFAAAACQAGERPVVVSAADFLSGAYDGSNICAQATVKDVFRDEINPDYAYLTLLWDGEEVYAAVRAKDVPDATLQKLVGIDAAIR